MAIALLSLRQAERVEPELKAALKAGQATAKSAKAQAAAIRKYCRKQGLLVGVGGQSANVIRFQPPLTISDNDLDRAVEILDSALKSVG